MRMSAVCLSAKNILVSTMMFQIPACKKLGFTTRFHELAHARRRFSGFLHRLESAVSALQRFQELDQVLPFLRGQAEFQVLVIVLNDLIQSLKAAVVVEATALAAP